jgi:two-component SAPR family response regulator
MEVAANRSGRLGELVSAGAPPTSARHPFRVLIVEGDKLHLFVDSVILRSRGYEVLACSTPVAAARVLKAERVDLAILEDCQIWGINGAELATFCKTARPQMKIILSCADVGRSSQELAFVDLFIAKSEGVRALVKGVEALLPRTKCRSG